MIDKHWLTNSEASYRNCWSYSINNSKRLTNCEGKKWYNLAWKLISLRTNLKAKIKGKDGAFGESFRAHEHIRIDARIYLLDTYLIGLWRHQGNLHHFGCFRKVARCLEDLKFSVGHVCFFADSFLVRWINISTFCPVFICQKLLNWLNRGNELNELQSPDRLVKIVPSSEWVCTKLKL